MNDKVMIEFRLDKPNDSGSVDLTFYDDYDDLNLETFCHHCVGFAAACGYTLDTIKDYFAL